MEKLPIPSDLSVPFLHTIHGFLRNAWAVGIIGQTNGPRAGYGPGITILMSSKKNNAKAKLESRANIINYIKFIK